MMERRRSSRLELKSAISKPSLMKRQSTTTALRGALEGLSTSDEPEGPEQPKRRSSTVSAASSRAKFMAMQAEESKPKPSAKAVVNKNKFDNKIAKFEAKAKASTSSGATAPSTGRGVASRLAAFRQKEQDELARAPSIRKTWKPSAGGYKKTSVIESADGRGPAAKRSLADLP